MENLDKAIGQVMNWEGWNGVLALVSVGVALYVLFALAIFATVGYIFYKVFRSMSW